jgi:hypothetical protein
MDKIVIECECGTHLLQVICDDDDGFLSFNLAMFGYGNQRLTWRRRLHYAWRSLIGKSPYGDQITLNTSEASSLSTFIIKNIAS